MREAAARGTAAVGIHREQIQMGEFGSGLAVDDHGVPLRECSALGVLAGHPDQLALGQERTGASNSANAQSTLPS